MHSANCSGLLRRLHFAVIRIRSGCIDFGSLRSTVTCFGENHRCVELVRFRALSRPPPPDSPKRHEEAISEMVPLPPQTIRYAAIAAIREYTGPKLDGRNQNPINSLTS